MQQVFEHHWVDSSAAPLHVWTLPAEPTDEDLGTFCVALRVFLSGLSAPYAMTIDASALRTATAKQRRELGDALKDHELDVHTWCAGTSVVLTSSFARGVATAVTWISSQDFPVEKFTDLESANRWCLEQLNSARESAG